MVPNSWKVGLIRCLLNTGKRICSSEKLFKMEFNKLRNVFSLNGYPRAYFEAVYEKFLASWGKNKTLDHDDKDDRKYVFGVPFVGAPSREYKKKISRLIKEHLGEDIFVYFSSCKVGSFFSLKSKTPFALKARVVYKFKCLSDSDNTYIGKTERHITTRAKEHLYHKGSNPSAVTTHIAGCEACKTGQLSVVNFSIVKQCRNDYRCKITESLIIKNENPALNKQRHNKGQSYLLRVF